MIRLVRTALAAVALFLSAPMMNAHPAPDQDGHVLTALWKQYEEASKADRPQKEAEILRRYTAAGRSRAFAADTVRQAVQMALQHAQILSEQTNRSASASKPAPPLVFIGGSAFVVAEALPLFR